AKLDRGESLNETELTEFYIFSNAMSLKLDSKLALAKAPEQLLTGLDLATKEEKKAALANILQAESGAISTSEAELKTALEGATIDYLTALENNANTSHKDDFNEYVSTAAEYLRLDFEHIRSFSDVETAVAQARQDLVDSALRNFFKDP